MARRWFTAGVLVGMVLTTVAGAALGIHAASEGGSANETTPPDEQLAVEVAQPEPTPEPPRGTWDDMARCEASSDWHNAKNPIYKGGLQFDSATWARYGGLDFAWRADFATRAQQIIVAERTLKSQGWDAWPRCSRKLGLR
jgi:hypothetical protein